MPKTFRINCKGLFLTYKGFIDYATFKQSIKTKKKYDIKLCWEIGATGYKHSHIILYFPKKIDTRNCRFFDIGEVHPNIKKIMSEQHFNNLLKYTDKFDQVKVNNLDINSYRWNGTLRSQIQQKKCWRDVINDDDISQSITKILPWAKEVFNCKPQLDCSKGAILKPWQKTALDILLEQNDRKILWIYDKKGNSGKSFLTNYIIDKFDAFFCNGGKLADIAYAYDHQEYCVFDLPRSQGDFLPYKCMECFKDGRIFSSKYMSCMKRFDPCKVIVFSNDPPDTSKVSLDRWNILEICNDQLTPRPLNIKVEVSDEDEHFPSSQTKISEECSKKNVIKNANQFTDFWFNQFSDDSDISPDPEYLKKAPKPKAKYLPRGLKFDINEFTELVCGSPTPTPVSHEGKK